MFLFKELRGDEHLLFGKTLQSLAREFVCGIGFTTDITNDTPTTAASLTNFVDGNAKAVAGRHSAADDWSAIRAHDHTVIRPARGGKIERARAHVRLQLSRTPHVRKAERLRINGSPSNKNGQATSGPAMLVQRGVHVDNQALPQTAFLPFGGCRGGPAAPGFRKSLTRCWAVVRSSPQHLASIGNPHELRG